MTGKRLGEILVFLLLPLIASVVCPIFGQDQRTLEFITMFSVMPGIIFIGALALMIDSDQKKGSHYALAFLLGYVAAVSVGILATAGNPSIVGSFGLSILGGLGLTSILSWGRSKFLSFQKRSKAEKEKVVAETLASERSMRRERIDKLVGNPRLTAGLLDALERLTKYVPEVADDLLRAIENDVERHRMLYSFVETTDNDVLKTEAINEARMIEETARRICSVTTSTALQLLTEMQAAEANIKLGEDRGSQIEAAYKDFKKFLDATREINRDVDASTLKGVIAGLRETKPIEITSAPSKRRLGSGGGHHKE